jgi:hypothetical protein
MSETLPIHALSAIRHARCAAARSPEPEGIVVRLDVPTAT